MKPLLLPVLFACGIAAAGCSTYRAEPLDRKAVDAALVAPPIESIKIEAARIRHPLLAPMEIDGRDGFTPDEIAVTTVIVSPELRALRAQQGVADAQVLQAGLLPNPSFNFELDRPESYPDPVSTQITAGLTWEITSLLSHRAQVDASKSAAKSLNLSIAWQEWQAAQDARIRAFRILSLERRLPLAAEIERAESETLAIMNKAFQAGQKTIVDLSTETAAFTAAQNARFDLERQLTEDRAELNLAMGLPPKQTVRVKPGTSLPELAGEPAALADGLLEGIEDRRLDLVALRYGYDSQEANLRVAVIQQFPKIALGFVHTSDTSSPSIRTNGPSVAFDLPLFDRNQGQVKIAQATRTQLFNEYVARVAQARSDVGRILANIAVVHSQLQTAETSIPDLKRVVDASEAALKNGNSDILAYRDAHAALATREMEQSELRQELLELGVALEIATGRSLLTSSNTHS